MNRAIPFACALALACTAPALAQIPNGSFENWYSNVNYLEPSDWWTTNMVTYQLAGAASCVQGSPGAVGSHYIEITSMTAGSIVEVGRTTCGDEFTGFPGFPFAQRPATFNGQLQYFPQGADQGQVYMTLTRWVPGTGRTVVATAVNNIMAPISGWQSFATPFTYLNGDTPDSARVFLLASMNTPVNGTSLWVDDLHVAGSVGLIELAQVPGLEVLPMGDGSLIVRATDPIQQVVVYDMAGRQVMRSGGGTDQQMLSMAGLSSGAYTIVVRLVDGRAGARRIVK